MSLAIIFNGQGAHYEGMGQDFAQTFAEAAAVYKLAEEITEYPVRQWITKDLDTLQQTRYAQVAITATSLAIFDSIKHQLPAVSYMAGLSLGEYSALIASGMLDQAEGFRLIKTRGALMTIHCESLRETSDVVMEAVLKMPLTEIKRLLEEVNQEETQVYLANLNSSTQVTIAGTTAGVDAFKALAREEGFKKMMPLKVEGPFHTPYMAEVQEPFVEALAEVQFQTGSVPVISNTTLATHTPEKVKDLLVRHLVEPVRWQETIDFFVDNGVTKIIQIGPGKTLANLLKREANAPATLVIDSVADIEKIEDFIGG